MMLRSESTPALHKFACDHVNCKLIIEIDGAKRSGHPRGWTLVIWDTVSGRRHLHFCSGCSTEISKSIVADTRIWPAPPPTETPKL